MRCPGCGATLPFDATLGKWKCASCGNVWDDKQILQLTKDSDIDTKNAEQNLNVYQCQSCGAQVVGDNTTSATTCAFCGSPIVLKGRLEGEYRPSRIIPFALTKDTAMKTFKDILKKEWFVPSEFTAKKSLESIQPIYIPFWLFSGGVEGEMKGTYKTIRTASEGNYRCTYTTTWHVEMEGQAMFDLVPADGSLKFDDKLMDSVEPFDYKGFRPFNYAYLSGYMAEKYDMTPADTQQRATGRMGRALSSLLAAEHNEAITVVSENYTAQIKEPEYVLLPVWILNTKFDGKTYTYAMNGQTGKMVGDTPISTKRIYQFVIGIFVAIMLIIELIAFLNYITGGASR